MNGERTALITGASKGIGHETARQLGLRGMTVLVGARDVERGARAVETLRGERIDPRPIAVVIGRRSAASRTKGTGAMLALDAT